MAELQSPTVEIAPTVIVSNSNESENNEPNEQSAGDAAHANGDEGLSGSALEPNANASDNVAIAEIEAERDVTLAAIHGDIERERIAVEAERIEAIVESNEDLEICRREIAQLTERVEALTLLIQPPVSEEVITELLETVPEPNSIPQSIQAPIAEMPMEPLEENAEENLVVEPVRTVRRFIAI